MIREGLNIIIAGGGTGGHLFPGIAIAKAFREKNPDNRLHFIISGKPFEKSALEKEGIEYSTITIEGIKRRNLFQKAVALFKIPVALTQTAIIFRRFKPHLVVGVGGYASGPVALAAFLGYLPLVLHEQNRLPGITNRLASRLARKIYVSFENTRLCVSPEKIVYTGNPIRAEILAISHDSDPTPKNGKKPFTVAILGGSQGAHRINMTMIETIDLLENKEMFHFIHQTGTADEEKVREAYKKNGISHEVRPFFFNMKYLYDTANLMICRAGATTVAEITAIGIPALFIPFPFAADDHQTQNAKTLVDAEAADMIPEKNLDGKTMAKKITFYMNHPKILENMARKVKQFGKPEAAKHIVEECMLLVENVS